MKHDRPSWSGWTGSIQRRLWLSIAAVVAAAALVAAIVSFVSALMEGEEQQDMTLQQIAALADRARSVSASVLQPRDGDEDVDTAIMVVPLTQTGRLASVPSATPPMLRLPAGLANGFHDVAAGGHTWRVLVTRGRGGRIAVAQETSVRFDTAVDGALRTLLPVLALLPILLVLVGLGIRGALRPLHSLAATLDSSDSATLHPLPLEGVPRELRPFIVSINELLERVSRSLIRERRFIADAAHELRTPIAVLQMQSDNLGRLQSSEPARERLRDLQDGVARMSATVEQLLTLARLQHRVAGNATPIDPGAVLARVLNDHLAAARQRQIELVLQRTTHARIDADEFQLYTLFRNAVDNAVKYSPAGGRVSADVARSAPAGEIADIVIEICDTGPGIPEADLGRVFEPFERLQGSGEATGVGLGLSIMRSVAENLGGTLRIENRAGGGLCVRYSQREAAPAPVV